MTDGVDVDDHQTHHFFLSLLFMHKCGYKQNWLQFLFVVKATALKQQMSKFIHKFKAQKLATVFIPVIGLL